MCNIFVRNTKICRDFSTIFERDRGKGVAVSPRAESKLIWQTSRVKQVSELTSHVHPADWHSKLKFHDGNTVWQIKYVFGFQDPKTANWIVTSVTPTRHIRFEYWATTVVRHLEIQKRLNGAVDWEERSGWQVLRSHWFEPQQWFKVKQPVETSKIRPLMQ